MRSFSKIKSHKSEIENLYRAGNSIRAISIKLKISKSTVGDYIRSLGISRSDISGPNNPFFGKKHSQQVRDLISRKNKGKISVNAGISKYENSQYVNGLLINKWKYEAKKRDINWNISNDEIDEIWEKQNGLCALTGKIMHAKFRGSKFDRASLDRIDSNGCYNKSNCQIVLGILNICKNTLNNVDFIKMCEEVARHAQSSKA
jgi:transposase